MVSFKKLEANRENMTTVSLYKFIRSDYIKSTIESGEVKLTQLSTSNDPLEFLPCGNSKKLQEWFKRTKDVEPLVLCLSPQISAAPMWSHYAENHQGAAIVFQFNIINTYCVSFDDEDTGNIIKLYIHQTDQNYFLVKCVYLNRRMKIVIDSNDWNEFVVQNADNRVEMQLNLWVPILKMISAKGKVWEYEQEYRLLFYDDEQVKNPKDTRCITNLFRDKIQGIILGLKRSKELTRAKVKKWCSDRKIFVDTAYRSEQTFEIQNNSTSDSIGILKELEKDATNVSWSELFCIIR